MTGFPGRRLLASGIVFYAIGWPAIALSQSLADEKPLQTSTKTNCYAEYSPLNNAPEKARVRQNPFEHDSQARAAGRKLFAQHCAQCHGNDANGSDRAPSLRADEVQRATPGTLFWVLTNGVVRRGMPVWSKLPEARRWQIVTYIQTLDAAAQPEPER